MQSVSIASWVSAGVNVVKKIQVAVKRSIKSKKQSLALVQIQPRLWSINWIILSPPPTVPSVCMLVKGITPTPHGVRKKNDFSNFWAWKKDSKVVVIVVCLNSSCFWLDKCGFKFKRMMRGQGGEGWGVGFGREGRSGDSARTNSWRMARYQLSVSHKEEKICLPGWRSAGWLCSSSNRRLFLFRLRHVTLPATFFFFHHIHKGSATSLPSGAQTGLTHRRVWNLWLDDGRKKKHDTQGEDVHFFSSPLKKKKIHTCQNTYYPVTRPQQSTLIEVLNPVSHQFELCFSLLASVWKRHRTRGRAATLKVS